VESPLSVCIVGYFHYGSLPTRYGLYPAVASLEWGWTPTPDLDAFLKAVTGRPDRASVRLEEITWNNALNDHLEAGQALFRRTS